MCTTIKVVDKPEQPSWICEDCDAELIRFYKFRMKCIESDRILSAVFVKTNVIVQTEYVEAVDCIVKQERISENELDDDQSFESDATAEFVHTVKVKTERNVENSVPRNVLETDQSYDTQFNDESIRTSVSRDDLTRARKLRKIKKRTQRKRDGLNEKPIEFCEICNKPLPRKRSAYNKHIRSHYPGNPTPFECKSCDRKFSNIDKLTGHVQIHSYPLKCNFCDVRFQSHSTKLEHENRKHTFVRPFKCDKCEMLFYTFNQMNRHLHSFHSPNMEQKS